jgi:hypothetical protein
MHDWQVPLAVATLVFGVFMLWKVRPAFLTRSRRRAGALLRDAHARIEAAKDDAERTEALCDAAEASLASGGGAKAAASFFLRAMRTSPHAEQVVDRAARVLAHRPHTLESLLWRRLGAEPWSGHARPTAVHALRHLRTLYAGPLRNPVRAKAMEHALQAMGEPLESRPQLA